MIKLTRLLGWVMVILCVAIPSVAMAQSPQEKKAGMGAKAPATKAPAAPLPLGGKGIEDSHFGFDGLNMYPNEVIIPNLTSIGAHWGRHPSSNPAWARTVNKEGVPDYSVCDRALEQAFDQGFMLTGDFNAFLPQGGPDADMFSSSELDLARFADYVRLTVERYDGDTDFGVPEDSPLYPKCDANGDGRISEEEKKDWAKKHRILYWQVENEPDSAHRRIPPRNVVDAMRVLYQTAKSVAPQVKIVFPGFMDQGGGDVALAKFEDFIRMGAGEYFDILDQHIYMSYIPSRMEMNNRIMAKYGYSGHWAKPWWITETGASSTIYVMGGGTPERQAQQVVKRYCLGFAKGVDKIFWFRGRDPGSGQPIRPTERTFGGHGLFDAEGNEKFGAKAYRLLTEKIDYFSGVEVLSMEEHPEVAAQPGTGVVMLRFTFAFKNPVYVGWSDDRQVYVIPVPKRWDRATTEEGMVETRPDQVKITDMLGSERTEKVSGDTLRLELTETPIYLEFSYPQS